MRIGGKRLIVLSALMGPVALSLLLLSFDFFRSTAEAQKIPVTPPAVGQAPVQPPAPPTSPPKAEAVAPAPEISIPAATPRSTQDPSKLPSPLSSVIEDYDYNPEGKRDPFVAVENPGTTGIMTGPIFPLQGYDLDQLKLVGIIWDVRYPKAMLLDPTGKGYVVKVSDRVGRNNGRIARIRESEIVVVESFKDAKGKVSYQTKVLRLQVE
jgi:type IV pilus assembly protein PilP